MDYDNFFKLSLHEQLKMLADEVEKITTAANSSYAATNALRGLAEKYDDATLSCPKCGYSRDEEIYTTLERKSFLKRYLVFAGRDYPDLIPGWRTYLGDRDTLSQAFELLGDRSNLGLDWWQIVCPADPGGAPKGPYILWKEGRWKQ